MKSSTNCTYNPLSHMSHYRVAELIEDNFPQVKSIIDVGGVGEAFRTYLDVERYVDANLSKGIDGRHLPFGDGEFDVGVSMYTLEHVNPEDRLQVVDELMRVSRLGCFMCFPAGWIANKVEDIKRDVIGHTHPIAGGICPDLDDIEVHIGIKTRGRLRPEIIPDIDPVTHLLGIAAIPKLNSKITMLINSMFKPEYSRTSMKIGDAYSVILMVKKDGTVLG